jgi:hypothetical protein
VTKFDANIWGQGNANLDLLPQGNTGSYFATQNREAERIGGATTFSFAPGAIGARSQLQNRRRRGRQQ